MAGQRDNGERIRQVTWKEWAELRIRQYSTISAIDSSMVNQRGFAGLSSGQRLQVISAGNELLTQMDELLRSRADDQEKRLAVAQYTQLWDKVDYLDKIHKGEVRVP